MAHQESVKSYHGKSSKRNKNISDGHKRNLSTRRDNELNLPESEIFDSSKQIEEEIKKLQQKIQDDTKNFASTINTQLELKLNALEVKTKDLIDDRQSGMVKKLTKEWAESQTEINIKITEVGNKNTETNNKLVDFNNKITEQIVNYKNETNSKINTLNDLIEKYKNGCCLKLENFKSYEKQQNPNETEQINIMKNMVTALDETTKNLVNKFNSINSDIINHSNLIKELSSHSNMGQTQKITELNQMVTDTKLQTEKVFKEFEEIKKSFNEQKIVSPQEIKIKEVESKVDFTEVNQRLSNLENKLKELELKKELEMKKELESKQISSDKFFNAKLKIPIEEKKEEKPQNDYLSKPIEKDDYQPEIHNPFEDDQPIILLENLPKVNKIKENDLPSLLIQPPNITNEDFSLIKEFEIKLINLELKVSQLNNQFVDQPKEKPFKNLEELENRMLIKFNQMTESLKKDFNDSIIKVNLRMDIFEKQLNNLQQSQISKPIIQSQPVASFSIPRRFKH